MEKFDFSGWATRNNLRCSDGRTIMKDAFKDNDGQTVPLVWNHQHNESFNVLGHALLENRNEGVYAYCTFNDTESGQNAKLLVNHGDVSALSIYANQLRQNGGNVIHGAIREVSLVLAGANPGAFIDTIIAHNDDSDEEAIIYTGENLTLIHAEEPEEKKEEDDKGEEKMAEKEKTVQEIFDTLNEEQKTVVYALIGQAVEDAKGGDIENDEEEEDVKHNIFDNEYEGEVLSHSEMTAVLADAKRYGSLKESALQHGITNIDYLFPEDKTITNTPDFIARDQDWVSKVMNGVHHTPFSRVKSIFANITGEEARALGYIKGKKKKEEVIAALKRSTSPQTVYKKQKLDRDDVIDITDFDVVAWLKAEMRMMLNEELARAFLIGDGRDASSDDKINPLNIRPIAFDDDLYTIKVSVAPGETEVKDFIKATIKARKDYKGSGNPTLFTTEDMLTDMLLLEDGIGHFLYESADKLAQVLRVKEIVTVPVMENVTGVNGGKLLGVIVNLNDYNVGADKGGAVSMFDDFDIDYNRQKYLIEERQSAALTRPYSAVVLKVAANG